MIQKKIILIKNLIGLDSLYRLWQISNLKFYFEAKGGFI